VPENDRPYLFETDYRGRDVKNRVRGSGLGLNVVKRIVENHQGKVWYEYEGGGNKFSFSIPKNLSEILSQTTSSYKQRSYGPFQMAPGRANQ